MSRFTTFVAVAFTLVLAPASRAANPYDDLLKHSSADTNTIVLIDLKQAFASEIAKKENWAGSVQAKGHGGLGFFPADSELLAIAAEVNLTTMAREHQTGFVKVKNFPNFNTLAAREGGSTDDIAGHLSVLSPRNVYFTTFTGGTLAAVSPADRQYVSRWLKANKAGKLPPLAPYLQSAADGSKNNTITIAIDLEDSSDPSALRLGLTYSPVMVKNKGVNLRGLSVFLSRAKGLTFSASVTGDIKGKISIEFLEDPRDYKALLKPLILEVIDGYGIYLPALEQWEATFTEKTMTLAGAMTTNDLAHVVSLFSFPQPELHGPADEPEGPNAAATKRYLDAVNLILADIQKGKNSNDYNKTATWHDKAAQQLEQLSQRSVDPIAVDAAYQAAHDLRLISGSLRGVPLDVNAAASKAYIYGYSSPNWGWGGWWGGYRRYWGHSTSVQTNLPQVQGEISKIIADDQKKRNSLWIQIDQLMSGARRKLTDKYKTGF